MPLPILEIQENAVATANASANVSARGANFSARDAVGAIASSPNANRNVKEQEQGQYEEVVMKPLVVTAIPTEEEDGDLDAPADTYRDSDGETETATETEPYASASENANANGNGNGNPAATASTDTEKAAPSINDNTISADSNTSTTRKPSLSLITPSAPSVASLSTLCFTIPKIENVDSKILLPFDVSSLFVSAPSLVLSPTSSSKINPSSSSTLPLSALTSLSSNPDFAPFLLAFSQMQQKILLSQRDQKKMRKKSKKNNEKLREIIANFSNLLRNSSEKKKYFRKLTDKVNKQKKEIFRLENENQSKKNSLEKHSSNVHEKTELCLKESEEIYQTKIQENLELQTQKNEKINYLSTISNTLFNLRSSNISLFNELSDYHSKINAKRNENEATEHQLNEQKQTIEHLTNSKAKREEVLKEKHVVLTSLEDTLQSKTDLLLRAKSDFHLVEMNLEKSEELIHQNEEIWQSFQTQSTTLQGELNDIIKDNLKLKEENHFSKSNHDSETETMLNLKKEKSKLNEKLSKLKIMNHKYFETSCNLEDKKRALNEQMANYENELQHLLLQLHAFEKKNEHQKRENEYLVSTVKKMSTSESNFTLIYNNRINFHSSLCQDNETIKSQINETRLAIEKKRVETEKCKENIASIQKKQNTLERKYSEHDKQLETYQQQIETIETKIKSQFEMLDKSLKERNYKREELIEINLRLKNENTNFEWNLNSVELSKRKIRQSENNLMNLSILYAKMSEEMKTISQDISKKSESINQAAEQCQTHSQQILHFNALLADAEKEKKIQTKQVQLISDEKRLLNFSLIHRQNDIQTHMEKINLHSNLLLQAQKHVITKQSNYESLLQDELQLKNRFEKLKKQASAYEKMQKRLKWLTTSYETFIAQSKCLQEEKTNKFSLHRWRKLKDLNFMHYKLIEKMSNLNSLLIKTQATYENEQSRTENLLKLNTKLKDLYEKDSEISDKLIKRDQLLITYEKEKRLKLKQNKQLQNEIYYYRTKLKTLEERCENEKNKLHLLKLDYFAMKSQKWKLYQTNQSASNSMHGYSKLMPLSVDTDSNAGAGQGHDQAVEKLLRKLKSSLNGSRKSSLDSKDEESRWKKRTFSLDEFDEDGNMREPEESASNAAMGEKLESTIAKTEDSVNLDLPLAETLSKSTSSPLAPDEKFLATFSTQPPFDPSTQASSLQPLLSLSSYQFVPSQL